MTSETRRPATVLVVDDDPFVRQLLDDMLRRDGFDVAQAGNGLEALAVLAARDDIAILLTDLVMPEREGLEIIRAVAAWPARPRVVAMSGYVDEPYLRIAALLGADAVLTKPISRQALRAALHPGTTAAAELY